MDDQENKRCARCRCLKPLSDFARKYGRVCQPYCRPCQAAYKQEHYAKHKARYIEQARRRQLALRARVRALKNCPCVDCGVLYPYYVMDFDHREGEVKVDLINQMVGRLGLSIKVILAEIAKCDVVCSNCHRIRTFQRQQAKMQCNRTTEEQVHQVMLL